MCMGVCMGVSITVCIARNGDGLFSGRFEWYYYYLRPLIPRQLFCSEHTAPLKTGPRSKSSSSRPREKSRQVVAPNRTSAMVSTGGSRAIQTISLRCVTLENKGALRRNTQYIGENSLSKTLRKRAILCPGRTFDLKRLQF